MALEPERRALAARGGEELPADVVDREPPLREPAGQLLDEEPPTAQAQTLAAHRRVQPVVDAPGQRAVLVFEVAPVAPPLAQQLARLRPAVAVGVAVDPQRGRVGLADDHAVVERQHEARQDEAFGEGRAPVHAAVAVVVEQHADPAARLVLAGAVDVLHVGAQLGDVRAAVAVEHAQRRLAHERLARDQFDAVPGRQTEGRRLGIRSLRRHAAGRRTPGTFFLGGRGRDERQQEGAGAERAVDEHRRRR